MGGKVLRWEMTVLNGPKTKYKLTGWGQTEQSARNYLKRHYSDRPWKKLIATSMMVEVQDDGTHYPPKGAEAVEQESNITHIETFPSSSFDYPPSSSSKIRSRVKQERMSPELLWEVYQGLQNGEIMVVEKIE